jgi:hypothetical protein
MLGKHAPYKDWTQDAIYTKLLYFHVTHFLLHYYSLKKCNFQYAVSTFKYNLLQTLSVAYLYCNVH